MVITSRRKFFGLMAAPAIIGISGRMQLWTPRLLTVQEARLIEPDLMADFTTDTMRYVARERWLTPYLEPTGRWIYGTPGQ